MRTAWKKYGSLYRRALNADRFTLWLADRERQELWTKVAHGLSSVRMPLQSGFAGYAVTNNTPVICNDPYNDNRFNPDVDKETGYSTKSIISIPVKTIQNDVLGSDRCYKKAWDMDTILELFKEQRGKHFDPKLIDIFFGNLDAFIYIREQYKD